MILSRVDFPHPEGPITATNSPFFTLMERLFKATVSTSSVRSNFWRSVMFIIVFAFALSSFSFSVRYLFDHKFLNFFVSFITGGNDLITRFQALQHFLVVRVLPSQLYIDAVGRFAVL